MGSYKLYQLIAFFVMKYSYKIINVQGQKADEIFLINPGHNYYPLIRLTIASIEQVTFEKDRLHGCVGSFADTGRLHESGTFCSLRLKSI